MIPVVFTHRAGVKNVPQGYLPYAIQQARQYNDRVILIGDQSNDGLDVEHYHYNRYAQGAYAFSPRYVHMCTNEHSFELWNLQEYFVLRDFMEAQKLDEMFLCDSDVMLYCNVEELGAELAAYSIACNWAYTQWEYRWSVSAHVSYWTLESLTEFCEYIQRVYTTPKLLAKLQEKWGWHQREGKTGGICDMTLLWLFCVGKKVINLARVRDNAVFDDNINAPENWLPNEYQMKAGIKEVIWRQNQPYGFNLELGKWIRFNALHFQGDAKKLLSSYAKEKYDNL